MSRIDELVAHLCPDGVEYRPLWSLTTWDKRFNAVNKSKQPRVNRHKYYLAKELEPLLVNDGDIKVLTTSPSSLWTNEELAGDSIKEGEIVAIPWGGNPCVQYYKGRYITSDNRIACINDPNELECRFLYYVLDNQLDEIRTFYRGAGIQHPNMDLVLSMEIPVPPLEIQHEIVRALDFFADLEVELEVELEARKAQYAYYRDRLLSDAKNADKVKLGDIVTLLDSKRVPIKQNDRIPGNIPYYGASGIVDYVQDYLFDGDYLLISEDGANLVARTSPIAFQISGKTWVNNHAHVLQIDSPVTRRYVEIVINQMDLTGRINVSGQPKLTKKNLLNIEIPLPSFDDQRRIVDTLDRFDALITSLTDGLPAEIEARRQQYEFYRDKLLDFPRKEVA